MAVTANQPITRAEGEKRSCPVAASTRIYKGTNVFQTAAGFADDDTATGVNGFLGIALEDIDNSGGSAGDLSVEYWAEGDFERLGSGFAQTDVGQIAYADDNFTVVNAIGATSVPMGRIVKFVSSTKVFVEIRPVGDGALPVAALTALTHTAPGTPDYAIQNLVAAGFAFVTADEGNTVLSVIKNLQQRVLDLEKRR